MSGLEFLDSSQTASARRVKVVILTNFPPLFVPLTGDDTYTAPRTRGSQILIYFYLYLYLYLYGTAHARVPDFDVAVVGSTDRERQARAFAGHGVDKRGVSLRICVSVKPKA